MTAPLAPALASRLQMLRVLWLAQFVSVALFTLVCVILSQAGGAVITDTEALSTVRRFMMIIAIALTIVSFWWRRTFALSRANPLFLLGAAGSEHPGDRAATILGRLQVNCIIVWALSEAVAIVGLILGVLSRDLLEYLPFAAGAVVLLYLHRPATWPLDRVSQAISF